MAGKGARGGPAGQRGPSPPPISLQTRSPLTSLLPPLPPSNPTSPLSSSSILPSLSAVSQSSNLDKKLSTGSLRSNLLPGVSSSGIIRKPTPEPAEGTSPIQDARIHGPSAPLAQSVGTPAQQTTPRTIPLSSGANSTGGVRRQGRVFTDTYPDTGSASPSTSPPTRQAAFRPRTHTMDGAMTFRNQLAPDRHRVVSISSAAALTLTTDNLRSPVKSMTGDLLSAGAISSAGGFSSIGTPVLSPEAVPSSAKSASRRLIKRTSSRPTSPLVSPPPSVDSLPLPIPTSNANNVLLLMRNLCGRMRGEIEYRGDAEWYSGIGYIEEEKGSLMFNSGDHGPFPIAIIPDLRGCRILPVECPDREGQCLEVTNVHTGSEIYLRPVACDEFDLWLAALLSWQQLRPGNVKPTSARSANTATPERPDFKRRGSAQRTKDGAIIKVGKVNLWDKGTANTPRGIVKRPSTRDLRAAQTTWRRVSCILQDNGEFKLMTENDVTVLSVIELPQLSRCAVQQLDKSVLNEEFCIAIFPIYAPTSTQLSIFRPVYIALDSRVLFEVWYVLLRAFMVPDIYALDPYDPAQVLEITDFESEYQGIEVFRMEKTISLRVTEAKLKPKLPEPGAATYDKHGKEIDPLVGNYLAEVILDGEVRARTTTKTDTKNPFWREDCEFADLPAAMPYLSVILKRQDGNMESLGHQLQASLGLAKTGHLLEYMCGSVDIPLSHLDKGKDHEQWLQIYDGQHQSIGSMLVKVHHEELAVLRAQEYRPLSELLRNFSSGLTAQISNALPGSLRRVAETLLNIFQASGCTSEWLMNLVEDEIDGIGSHGNMRKLRFGRRLKSNDSIESASDREQLVRDMGKSLAGEANLLFRGNSLLTQALEFHMRRLGNEYLEETLAEKIFEINEVNHNCEVDPGKLQQGEDLQQHWGKLIHYTTEIWNCIAVSAQKFPQELRQILKYVRAVAEDRYGDFHVLRTVAYTSVSGFLFLRFICPALLNPKLSGLLRDHPRPRAQRTLTLIAKGLQAMANLSTIGRKEQWMEPMNKFINSHRQSVKDFIDNICAVPAERSGPVHPPSYSTPMAISSRLPQIAREGLPSLPYLIDLPREFAALIRMWNDTHHPQTPGSTPSGGSNPVLKEDLDGDLLKFDRTCTLLSNRADKCARSVETLRAADTASHWAHDDHYAVNNVMDHLNLEAVSNHPTPWMEHEASARPPGSAGSDAAGSGGSRPLLGTSRSGSRDRWGRQISYGSDGSASGEAGKSLSSLGHNSIVRNGRQARKFLSGLVKKSRTASPDVSPSGRDRDGDRDREYFGEDKHKSRHKDKDKSSKEKEKDKSNKEKDKSHKEKDKGKDKSLDRGRDPGDKDRGRKKDKERDKDKEKARNGSGVRGGRDTSTSSKASRGFGFGHIGTM